MLRKALPVLCVVGFCLVVVGMAFAEPAPPQEEVVTRKSWFDLFKSTGIVGILLLILSVVGTALLINFMMNINEQKLGNPVLVKQIEDVLTEGNLEEAFALAESDQSYAGKVLSGSLSRSFGGYDEVKKGMDEAAAVESFRVNAKLSYLSLVGNIGPLMGLLGTVTGMITSFQKIETMKNPTPGDLAVGVYESLVNTTMGLFIAIVFLSAYFFMKNKVSDVMLRINNEIGEMLSRTMSPEAQQQQGGQK